MPKLKNKTIIPTETEDKKLTRAAKQDPDNPEWTDEMFAAATIGTAAAHKLGGRPKSDNPKQSTTIRFSPEVLDYFKSQGKGWQTRINEVLREHVRKHSKHKRAGG